MKKVKTFKQWNFLNEAEISKDAVMNGEQFETTPENIAKLIEYQKEHGGVIRIPNEPKSISLFKNAGYEIKTVRTSDDFDKEMSDDIGNFNKVNYVVIVINDTMQLIDHETEIE